MAQRPRRKPDASTGQTWADAYKELRARPLDALQAADMERLAVAAYLIGQDSESAAAWEAAHRLYLELGDTAEAARSSFWLAFGLMMQGEGARAGAWLNRTADFIEHAELDCAAAGYVMIPRLLGELGGGNPRGARDIALAARKIGERFDDSDLRAFAGLGYGQALIAMGDATAGVGQLDDVMVSVTAGEVGPVTTGIVYCAVILECMQLFDLPRASEWTRALAAWCDAQPDLVPYRGQCLVHRSQLEQAAGDWSVAMASAEAACHRLSDPLHPALGVAFYQSAELHRLTGALERAEADYRQASHNGFDPMPGLALLEFYRGDIGAADATLRRALAETGYERAKPEVLAAAAEVFGARGDVPAVRTTADALAEIARGSSSEVLKAMAEQAVGTALQLEGDPIAALAHLRAAAESFLRLRLPYARARAAVLVGLSCAALGDQTSADVEFASARDHFMTLGAGPDIARLDAVIANQGRAPAKPAPRLGGHKLTVREREVLRHLAAGQTNREIANELTISEHTVGRHVDNIFSKLGVTSRAAATAYAYEHGLL